MASAASWSTRANALTLVRLLLAPAIAGAILQGMTPLAAWLLGLAIATDFADGWVARRYGEESAFGGFADHAVDALLVTAGTAALACAGVLPAPLPWLIALAFTQYALDSRIVAGHALRASAVGRWNGIAYYVVLAIPLVRDALALSWPADAFVRQLGWLLVASTLVSMGDRLLTYWRRGD
ncbi:MAG: CDP-alcohol phosphatidyltransferase family protein [Myxococcota bacterium]